MTPEQMEHAIEFLLHHHAKVSGDIERNSEQIARLTANVERQSEQIAQLSHQAELDRQEMRETIENLIIGNEVTRDLAQKVAHCSYK